MLDAYMRLTTRSVVERIGDGEVEWTVTVMSPMATAKLLSIIPNIDEEVDVDTLIREHYLMIAQDIVYPCIVSPKIPVERLTAKTVTTLFPEIFEMSFPKGEGDDGFREE